MSWSRWSAWWFVQACVLLPAQDDAARQLAALDPMFGGRPFVVRFVQIDGDAPDEAEVRRREQVLAAQDGLALAAVREHLDAATTAAAVTFLRGDAGQALAAAEWQALVRVPDQEDRYPRVMTGWLSRDDVQQIAYETATSSELQKELTALDLANTLAGRYVSPALAAQVREFCASPAGARWIDARSAAFPATKQRLLALRTDAWQRLRAAVAPADPVAQLAALDPLFGDGTNAGRLLIDHHTVAGGDIAGRRSFLAAELVRHDQKARAAVRETMDPLAMPATLRFLRSNAGQALVRAQVWSLTHSPGPYDAAAALEHLTKSTCRSEALAALEPIPALIKDGNYRSPLERARLIGGLWLSPEDAGELARFCATPSGQAWLWSRHWAYHDAGARLEALRATAHERGYVRYCLQLVTGQDLFLPRDREAIPPAPAAPAKPTDSARPAPWPDLATALFDADPAFGAGSFVFQILLESEACLPAGDPDERTTLAAQQTTVHDLAAAGLAAPVRAAATWGPATVRFLASDAGQAYMQSELLALRMCPLWPDDRFVERMAELIGDPPRFAAARKDIHHEWRSKSGDELATANAASKITEEDAALIRTFLATDDGKAWQAARAKAFAATRLRLRDTAADLFRRGMLRDAMQDLAGQLGVK